MEDQFIHSSSLKRKRKSTRKYIENRWVNDNSKGSSGFVEHYKTKAPKFNPIPFCGGSPGLGKRK